MKSAKKIISLALILSLLCACLASCASISDEEKNEIIAGADGALAEAPYRATVKTTFSSDSDEMKAAIEAVASSSIVYLVNGDDFTVTVSANTGSARIYKSYVGADGILYHELTATIGGSSTTIKDKAQFPENARTSILASLNTGAIINHNDFNDVELRSKGKSYVLEGGRMDQVSLLTMTESFSKLPGTKAVASNVEYEALITDGKYVSATLTVDYSVTMNGVTYTVTVTTLTAYEYDTPVDITAPTDADLYTDRHYNDII